MREIKFRGLRADGKGWVYGQLAYLFNNKEMPYIMPYCFFGTRDFGEEDDNGNPIIENNFLALGGFISVKSESVGQFIDLHDKNGKEIYEGDVVFWDYEKIVVSYGIQGVDAFEGVGFNLWGHYGKKQDGTRIQSEMEVIGNIHENPERL
jgi:uncharacterized phage protein (TIGR01671 family)